MRILQVIDGLKQRAGVASVVMNYYRFIDKTRIQFDFLVVEYEEHLKEEVERLGGRVYTIEKLQIQSTGRFCKELEDFFSQHHDEYKIVHSHFYQIDFLLFPIAKKHGVTHCIMHSHNTKYADYTFRKIRNWALSKLSCRKATDFAACSAMAGAFLFGEKVIRQKGLFLLNNAVDTHKFIFDNDLRNNMRRQLGVENKYVIGHVGRFCGQKNHAFLLRAFAQYAKMDEQAVLLLIGEGELYSDVKNQAVSLGINDKVLFLGRRTDVPALLQAMDCFVFPSRYEGLGMAVVEAQAAGLPCAASVAVPRDAGVTELLQFFPLDNVQPWVDWITGVKAMVRRDTSSIIVQKGYDLVTQAVVLESYYAQLANS